LPYNINLIGRGGIIMEPIQKVVFECYENGKEFSEEMEFAAGTTDEEIEEEWKEWVWNQVRDYYGWRRIFNN
jgi:hypothetical protein